MSGFLPGDDPTPTTDPGATDPTPEPIAPPTADPGRTIGDVIGALTAAEADESAKKQAAAEADAAYAQAQDATSRASAELKDDIAVVQAAFVQDGDAIVVYLADASEAGYHAIRPVPASTSIRKP